MSRTTANFLLILVAMVWGGAFVAQNHGMDHMGPLMFTGVRFLMGALVVTPLVWRERRQIVAERRKRTWRDTAQIAGLGVLLSLGANLQQIGIGGTSVTNAGFLTAVYVPLVPVLGWLLFRQLPHWSVWPGVLACLLGAYLLSGASGFDIGAGDLWVIAAAIPWAFHVLLVGRVADRLHAPYLVACGQFFICGLMALLWGLAVEPLDWDGIQAAAIPLAYAGFASVGFAYTAQVVAQRFAHATDAAIVLSSETLFAALCGYWWMGDRIGARGLLGCALIFISMMAVQLLALWRVHSPDDQPHQGPKVC